MGMGRSTLGDETGWSGFGSFYWAGNEMGV